MAYECLTNLIGITNSDCDCTVAGLDDATLNEGLDDGEHWYDQSLSGLFLDQLEGIVPLQAAGQSAPCSNEMARFYYDARNSAIKTMIDDILIGITQRAVNGQKSYIGKIAGTSYTSAFDLTAYLYAGVKMYTVPMKGGVIKINKIYAMMDAAATFDILVYKLERGATIIEEVTTITGIQSLANTVKENVLAAPVEIELSQYGADFYFLYVPSGFNSLQNTTSCGCGHREYLLRNFLQINGVIGNDINAASSFLSYTNAMGLSFEGSVGCDTTKIICEAYNADDKAVATVMPYAARFKAGELVHEFISKSGNINRYTMTSQESIWGKRNHFRSEYNSRINWLVENINLNLIDCYICNDKRIVKGGIRV